MIRILDNLHRAGEERLYPREATIAIGMGTCGIGSGANLLYGRFKEEVERRALPIQLRTVGCFGACSEEPLVMTGTVGLPLVLHSRVTEADVLPIIEAVLKKRYHKARVYCKISEWDHHLSLHRYGTGYSEVPEWDQIDFFRSQKKLVLRNAGIIDPDSIAEYVAVGGYRAFSAVLGGMSRGEVIQEIKDARLRGRGGAGFPTGLKWDLMARETDREKYLICNADEGDPGAYMNRNEMESDPHSLIEGMLIAAYATSAKEGIIYVRAEYPLAVKRLRGAIRAAYGQNLLGKNILGSHFSFDLSVVEGAGAFVCGEETALMASIQGERGMPYPRPPFPANKGLWDKPTNINNVETWANVPTIIRNGGAWYASIGTEKSKGTKVFALTGKVNNTGLVEVPMGTTLRDIVFDMGGGILNNRKFKAVQIGGPSGGCLAEEHLDLPVDYESLTAAGAIMGSGGLVVIDEDTCMVDVSKFFLEFTQKESCGKCVPCREGTKQMLLILDKISSGKGRMEDLKILEDLAVMVKEMSLCGLGQTAPNPVLTTLRYFRDEYEAHIRDKKCPAMVCKALISYVIDPEKCRKCGLCAKNCPVNCIAGDRNTPYVIDQEKCIKCGTCLEVCPFQAVSKV